MARFIPPFRCCCRLAYINTQRWCAYGWHTCRYAEWLAAQGHGADYLPGYELHEDQSGGKLPPGAMSTQENIMSLLVLVIGVATSTLALWSSLFRAS